MSGIEARARFDIIRYAQVWEDADVLLAGLAVRPGDRVLSVSSAGDNVLALLTADPERVVAVDLSYVQLNCLGFRIEAYRCLQHDELLELMGSRPSSRRREIYTQVVDRLPPSLRGFWAPHADAIIAHGFGGIGKFENYFRIFRELVLPLLHSRRAVDSLLMPKDPDARRRFHDRTWHNLRWRWMLKGFFSKTVMGRLGRDPSFFSFAEGSFPDQVAASTRHALVDLDPAANPYLHWILRGTHGDALPLALRPENFETIRGRLDRIQMVLAPIDGGLLSRGPFDAFNLSDIFEYMDEATFERVYGGILDMASPGARLLYWNMMAPRSRPAAFTDRVERQEELVSRLHAQDKAFFYMAVHAERVA